MIRMLAIAAGLVLGSGIAAAQDADMEATFEMVRSFMENDKRREILPGFFAGEAGVYSIRLFGWNRLSARRFLASTSATTAE